MKGITTIASLPSGAGQAAHLPAEVGEAKPAPRVDGLYNGWGERIGDAPDRLPAIDADMLEPKVTMQMDHQAFNDFRRRAFDQGIEYTWAALYGGSVFEVEVEGPHADFLSIVPAKGA